MNPMLQSLNNSHIPQNITPIKNMMNVVRSAGNPQMVFNQMIGQNPQIKQVMDYVNANGGDPKTAFYKLAQEKGVDPDEIIKQLM